MQASSSPVNFMPDAQRWEKMNEKFAAILPWEFAGAINLMAHPVAGAAAFSALGLGVASQAFGVWMGAVAGAAQASQRLLVTEADEEAGEEEAFASSSQTATVRARAVAKTLMADARAVARDMGEAADALATEKTKH